MDELLRVLAALTIIELEEENARLKFENEKLRLEVARQTNLKLQAILKMDRMPRKHGEGAIALREAIEELRSSKMLVITRHPDTPPPNEREFYACWLEDRAEVLDRMQ